MTGVTIRPGSDTAVNNVSFTGAATGWQATNDTNNATYAAAASGVGYPKGYLRMRPASGGLGAVGASQRILRVRVNATIRANAATSQNAAIKIAMRSDAGKTWGTHCVPVNQYDFWETMSYNDAVTFTTRFGVWRNKPPAYWGSEWTVNAVQNSSVEFQWAPAAFSNVNLRLSEVYFDIDYRDVSSVSAVSITNPNSTTHPTVSWTFNPNGDGDPQVAYRVKIFRSDQYTYFGFNPATTPPHWDSGVLIGNATQVVVGNALNSGQTYAAYVQAAADFGGQKWWGAWANSFPATILLTQLPAPTMISLTKDTAIPFIRNRISVQSNMNLLNAQDAGFDAAGIGNWSSFAGAATLTRVTTPIAQGSGALQLQKNGSIGDAENVAGFGTNGFRAKVGQSYTALASFRAAATARQCSVGIAWYNRTGGNIASQSYGTAVTSTTTGFTQASVTITAPANAAYGSVWVKIAAMAASEIAYVDKVHVGTNVVIGSGTVVGQTGVTQPTVAAIYDSGYWLGGSKAIVCNSVPAASLLVAITCSGQSASTTGNVVTDSTGLTWTNRQENATASTGDGSVSTAYFSAGGNTTVTVTAAGSQSSGCRTLVYAVTGHDEVTFGGASVKASATTGTANVSLTTTRENSLVIVGVGDFNSVNGNGRSWRKPGINFAEDFYGDFGSGATYFSHQIRPSAGAATEGLLSPSGQAYGIVAIEIRGATVNNIQTVYTGWATGGLVGTASTVIERALVSTGNRNNAHPQLWSGGDWYKDTEGFYLPNGQLESSLTYDVTDRFDGEGSIRWNVNNTGSKLFLGWPDGPRLVNAPQMVMLGIETVQYTFSLYAKASSTFNSTIVVQALDQFGGPVGSPGTQTIAITTSWAQYSCQMTMPMGALWVQATLTNDSSVTEQRVWVDGIQWVEGTSIDTIPQFGMGVSVDWQEVRGANQGDYLITDTEAGLIGNVFDNEAPPGYGIVYRAYNYLPATDTVPAVASPITFYATSKLPAPGRSKWILRDPLDATLAIQLHVTGMSENMHEESTVYYPLRASSWDQIGQRAVTVTDFIGGFDGELKVICDSEAEWLILRQILARPRPMWLIFPEHGARYVRFQNRSWDRLSERTNQATRADGTTDSVWRREVALPFLESDAP